jgi:beta-carotene 3-hydroxylase
MILFSVLICLGFFVLMELVAWFAHKYLMHGFLWNLHHDHHKKEVYSFWERNDFFFLIFATPGITLMVVGMLQHYNWYFWAGTGIALYGMCYFIVHDVFIHQRLPFLKRSNNQYLRAIRKAHKVHHKHLNKEDGECFGMLWVPIKYFKESKMNA